MMEATNAQAVTVVETRKGKFQVEVVAAGKHFLVDEYVEIGGLGSGPNPYDLLKSALGACTVMTLRLYAEHKKIPLDHVGVRVTHHRPSLQSRDIFSCEITLKGTLGAAERQQLFEVAQRCPVHKTLDRGSDIETKLVDTQDVAPPLMATAGEHVQAMMEAAPDIA
jgi:putative redox protein